jgi:hypothetical protein
MSTPAGLAELRINGLVQRCAQDDHLSRINNFSGRAALLAQATLLGSAITRFQRFVLTAAGGLNRPPSA